MQDTLEALVDRIEELHVIDGVAGTLSRATSRATSETSVKNLLSGTWLGHPVHPVLTDVVVGSFMSATLLDLMPGKWARSGADALVVTGLIASVPTAATGANDWSDTVGGTRRIGLVHAVLNTVATILYGWSLVKRVRGERGKAVTLSLFGFSVAGVSAYLGGHLTYRRGIGVDDNVFTSFGPHEWTPAIALDELPMGELRRVSVDGHDLAMLRNGGVVYAVADHCSHEGGPLSEGHVHLRERAVSCPWHHSTFSLIDGRVERGPATAPQPAYQTRIVDGKVEVRRLP